MLNTSSNICLLWSPTPVVWEIDTTNIKELWTEGWVVPSYRMTCLSVVVGGYGRIQSYGRISAPASRLLHWSSCGDDVFESFKQNTNFNHLEHHRSELNPLNIVPYFVTAHSPQLIPNDATRQCQAGRMPTPAPLYLFRHVYHSCPRNLGYRQSTIGISLASVRRQWRVVT